MLTPAQLRIRDVIQRVGVEMTYVKRVSAFDPTTNSAQVTNESIVCYGVVTDYTDEQVPGGADIQRDDRKIVIPYLDLSDVTSRPTAGDEVQIGTDVYNVIHAQSKAVEGAHPTVWEIQGRLSA